jgi:hypothetical protein
MGYGMNTICNGIWYKNLIINLMNLKDILYYP